MVEILSKFWWVIVLRGAAAVLFGLLALIWPSITVTALVLLFGAYALVDGVLALGTAIFGKGSAEGRRPWLVLEGVSGIAAGIITFIWPGITALVLLVLIALWAVVTGVVEIVAAIILRQVITREWLLGLAGVLSILFGIVLLIRPSEGAIAVVWLIGIYAIMFGTIMVALGVRLRQLLSKGTIPGTERPAPA